MKHTFVALCLCALFYLIPTQAQAKTCALALSSNDAMKFDQSELRVAADCTEVKLTLKHAGSMPADFMGHNWVLTKTADVEAVANAGAKLPAASDHVPKGDARVLANTKVIGGGESTSITFSTKALKKGGDYSFFCSFPGHWAMMKGKLVFG
ncbi:MAG: azurin [Pseudoxanthomonas sp.]